MTDRIEKDKETQQDWDIYWAGKVRAGNAVYDFLAGIYRRLIVKNILNHFMNRYFANGSSVLHAGCGSGQVDVDQTGRLKITALDISENALKIYRSVNGKNAVTVQGSIFQLPFPNDHFDGIYNLGVLEHFTEEEIRQILTECRRVLKPGGRILVLWPPTFGFTVFVLDSAHFILNRIFRMNIKLHPEEITRARGRKHAVSTFENANFTNVTYYFGIRDLFTQVVVSGEKSKSDERSK